MIRPSRLIDRADASAGTRDATVYVLGGGPTGATVARRLRTDDHAVALIDDAGDARDAPTVPTRCADPTDPAALADAGVDGASTAVAATPSDARNLLVAQLAVERFGVERVVVRTNRPDRRNALADAGHDPVCATTAVADALADRV